MEIPYNRIAKAIRHFESEEFIEGVCAKISQDVYGDDGHKKMIAEAVKSLVEDNIGSTFEVVITE